MEKKLLSTQMTNMSISLLLVVRMAGGSNKFLQFFQKCHQIIGIYPPPPKSNQKQYLTNNPIRIIFLISSIQVAITQVVFLMLESRSVYEYCFACLVLITTANINTLIYLTFIRKLQNTLKFIANCEELIETSKNKIKRLSEPF